MFCCGSHDHHVIRDIFVKVKMPSIIRYGVVQLWSKQHTLEMASY